MATTIAAAQRDLMVTAVRGLLPTALAQTRFVRHDEKVDFRLFSDANPTGAFRRFSVRDVGLIAPPEVMDTSQIWVATTFECVVAYPHDFRYGASHLALDDVLWADLNQIDDVIGTRGFATFGDAVVTLIEKGQEAGVACRFGVLRLKVEFWRATT